MRAPPAVALDFAPVRRRSGPLGWLLLALGLAFLAVEGYALHESRQDLLERERIVAALRQQRAGAGPRPVPVVALPLTRAEVTAANRVSAQIDADWGGVFHALSRVRNADVAWVEVDGDAARNGLRLTGQARSLEAVLAALERVRGEPALAGAELLAHEENTVEGVRMVRFVISAPWGKP